MQQNVEVFEVHRDKCNIIQYHNIDYRPTSVIDYLCTPWSRACEAVKMGTHMGQDSHLTPPLITIAITCHNAADTIERAVGSALAQDWPNLEVVVVDDCSTDGSWATLKALMRGEERMRVVRHEANRGYPGALNTAIGAARGAFV